MRQVVLDTETTGLEPEQGHRIIEVGCVELVNRRITGRTFHKYVCPDRDVEEGAEAVHGLTNAFLADKPHFRDVGHQLLEFIDSAELVIHNAPFDVGFLDHEFGLLGESPGTVADNFQVLDTLELARVVHPGQRNSLDALCGRYGVDNSQRELHGALLDAQLLAEVYLAMTGGQGDLSLEGLMAASGQLAVENQKIDRRGLSLRVMRATQEEIATHLRYLATIDEVSDGRCVWMRLELETTEGSSSREDASTATVTTDY